MSYRIQTCIVSAIITITVFFGHNCSWASNTSVLLRLERDEYVIRETINLQGKTLELPLNRVIRFEGGGFINGTLVFNNNYISTHDSCLSILRVNVKGKLDNIDIKPEWFYEGVDYSLPIQKSIDLCSNSKNSRVLFEGKRYLVRGGIIKLKSNIKLFSDKQSVIFTRGNEDYRSILFQELGLILDSVIIDGLRFDQTLESTKSAPVNRHCIQLFFSRNLQVQNCVFDYVGTNAICVTGTNCINTTVRNNTFVFHRLNHAGLYDVSAIYIEDGNHLICNNIIYNNELRHRWQQGGIETHGAKGRIQNNIIKNCLIAINVVSFNHDSIFWDGIYDRVINDNSISDCINCIMFWPITGREISGVKILNNNATNIRRAIVFRQSPQLTGAINNISVTNNTFSAAFQEFKEINDRNSEDYLLNNGALSLENIGVAEVEFCHNTFTGFPAMIIDASIHNQSKKTTISFRNNCLYNCYNSIILAPISNQEKMALFSVGKNVDLYIYNNTFQFVVLDKSIVPVIVFSDSSSDVTFVDNIMEGIASRITLGDGHPIIRNFAFKGHKVDNRIIPRKRTVSKGEIIVINHESYKCTSPGTDSSVSLSNGVIYGGLVPYLTCHNSYAIEVGDWLKMIGVGVPLQKVKVSAIVGERIYVNANIPLQFGHSRALSSVSFSPYKLTKVNE